uniref:Amino acid transporter n=1 Tax=Panagrolaimus sp. ES5 TaxID=591445 RepID=A0AC34GU91_9BILA
MTILSVIIGLILGFVLRGQDLSQETIVLINFPGEIFMQILKLMILPLIFASLVAALAQMDPKESGQMGLLTVGYYTMTTVLSTITGIILVLLIHPGDPTIKNDWMIQHIEHTQVSPLDTFLDVVRNMFPENVIQAAFQRVQTVYVPYKHKYQNVSNHTHPSGYRKQMAHVPGMNILGIIVFCTGFGIVISQFGEKAKIIVDFFVIFEAVIMKIVELLMWFAPLGIVCLIAGNLLELEDLSDTAAVLLMYVLTVIAGLLFHTIVTMPCVYLLLTRKNPLRVVKGMTQALVTAFGTASGGAALPISMQCLEENLKVDRRIARFVLPLGSTINMDGNALYEAVAVIFIAQLNNITLSLAEVITVSFIATIASLGLNSVPAGLVSILVILNTVGLPINDVSLIITVDWLLDRMRTSINVLGDAFVADAIAYYLGDQLKETDKENVFHQEIQDEIKMLASASHSRRTSNASAVMSSRASIVPPQTPSLLNAPDPLNWKQTALLQKLYADISLGKVEDV